MFFKGDTEYYIKKKCNFNHHRKSLLFIMIAFFSCTFQSLKMCKYEYTIDT